MFYVITWLYTNLICRLMPAALFSLNGLLIFLFSFLKFYFSLIFFLEKKTLKLQKKRFNFHILGQSFEYFYLYLCTDRCSIIGMWKKFNRFIECFESCFEWENIHVKPKFTHCIKTCWCFWVERKNSDMLLLFGQFIVMSSFVFVNSERSK